MADITQIELHSSLPKGKLLVQRVHATEALGRPFHYDLDLLSKDPALDLDQLAGDKMTIEMATPEGPRYFNGIAARVSHGAAVGTYTRYQATLRPFFWLLTRASDSRIYKQASVPDIVKEAIGRLGVGSVNDKGLQTTYLAREYVVQYRETYFDFLSRLMEEEGIYYWFQHEKGQHVMMLGDDRASHKTVPGYEKLPFIDPKVNASPRQEHFSEWRVSHAVVTGTYAVNDFDFEVPGADLQAKSSRPLKHKHASLEKYDPIAGYVDAVDAGKDGDGHRIERGDLFARVRLEEQQAEHDRVTGRSNARGLTTGALFEITGHTRDDQNRELLVIGAEYRLFQPGFDAASSTGRDNVSERGEASEDEPMFQARYFMQPGKTPFRPERTTPRPLMRGPHTATVVGDGEIWTDKYARVKVHFPWDREDKEGCWLRVAQTWAGPAWGALHIPRVGQEVIVEFIEGDINRPIVMGSLYNGKNAPPFGQPGDATRSGVLTRSSSGGSADTANELSFEDKAGEEQILIHAQLNMDTEVEKDQTLWVGRDRKNVIDNDQSEEVKGHKKIKVHKTHTEDIDETMSLRVLKDVEENIGGNRTIEVTGNFNENITGKQGVTVAKDGAWSTGGAGSISFGGEGSFSTGKKMTQSAGADYILSVNDNATASVGKNLNMTVDQNAGIKVEGGLTVSVTKDANVTVKGTNKNEVTKAYGLKAKEITIEAGSKIILKQGGATITLEGGNIVIKAGTVDIKGDSAINMKAPKMTQN
jgi:type VI secretion system secreted protein VgrG